jgi:hypothetical protein
MRRLTSFIYLYLFIYCKPNVPIAIIEAKDNNHGVGSGHAAGTRLRGDPYDPVRVLVQPLDGFFFPDRTGTGMEKGATSWLDAFPSPSGWFGAAVAKFSAAAKPSNAQTGPRSNPTALDKNRRVETAYAVATFGFNKPSPGRRSARNCSGNSLGPFLI